MAIVLATVNLPHKNGIEHDTVVNTFVFQTPTTAFVLADAQQIGLSLNQFYNVIKAGQNAIAGWMGPQLSRTAPVVVKMTEINGFLDGSPHGSPDFLDSWNLGPMVSGGVGMPAEVAVCLSIHGGPSGSPEFGPGTRPRARHRGRIYLGPLVASACITDGTTGRVSVTSGVALSFHSAAQALVDFAGHEWHVWSRANAQTYAVVGGWTDDAFDTQRRRGEEAVVRTVWGVPNRVRISPPIAEVTPAN